MQMECIAAIRAGVNWDEVHLLAHKIAIDGLLEIGIFKGTREEILESQTSLAFFPHGLGHYLGLETHDTGGHPDVNDENKLFRYLRTRGVLPAGSVITVEPGVSITLMPGSGGANQVRSTSVTTLLHLFWKILSKAVSSTLLFWIVIAMSEVFGGW